MSQIKAQQILSQFIDPKTEQQIKERVLHGYALLRSTHFTLQQLSLPWFEFLATGKKPPTVDAYKKNYEQILPALNKTLLEDAKNIAQGFYPLEVLKPENPWKHTVRFPKILKDGYAISKRRMQKDSQDFGAQAQDYLQDLPEYYKRNFHFQTDGYLSDHSAELYEHQVEILFAGAADAMRRSIIPLLKQRLNGTQGEGLRFLEVGAGTGRLTRFMRLAFPKAQITAIDISEPYLQAAALRLKDLGAIDFEVGTGEKLTYEDGSFDVVYSCFLFHELPKEVRIQVLQEGLRVLKSGGVYGLVDSLQLNDESFEWALEQFPKDFHEPFYRNYTQFPMEDLLVDAGFSEVESKKCFLSKTVVSVKT